MQPRSPRRRGCLKALPTRRRGRQASGESPWRRRWHACLAVGYGHATADAAAGGSEHAAGCSEQATGCSEQATG
eukprot:4438198-Prymnesium_polylepis.1